MNKALAKSIIESLPLNYSGFYTASEYKSEWQDGLKESEYSYIYNSELKRHIRVWVDGDGDENNG